MNPKRLILCLALVGAPLSAAAQSVEDQVVTQLRAQGFSEITVTRTWLGRLRFVAERDTLFRELVINPQTGEILRDYWRADGDDEDDEPRVFVPGNSEAGSGNSGSGGNDDDEDDDDDDDDDDDEDDDDEDDDDDDEDDD